MLLSKPSLKNCQWWNLIFFFFSWLLILIRKDTLSIFSFQSWAIGTFSREILKGTLAKSMPYVLFRGVFQVKGALSLVLKMCCICCWYTSYLLHSGRKPTWCLLAGCSSNVWDVRGQRGTCGHDYCWCRLPWVGAGVALLLLLQGWHVFPCNYGATSPKHE